MKKIAIFSLFLLGVFIYLYYLSQVEIQIIPSVLQAHNPTGYYDYRGVTHAHTDRDIGSGDFAHVVEAAREARLDFLIITNMNQFPSQTYPQGYYEGTLVLNANEYSYLDSHILHYSAGKDPHFDNLGQAQVYLTDLLTQKHRDPESGLLVVAHPLRPGYSWENTEYPGLNGIEVVNLKSIWENSKDHSPTHFVWSTIILPFNSNLSFLRTYIAPEREEALWDTMNSPPTQNLVIGYVGNNSTANAIIFPPTRLKFPEYAVTFSLASNHVLLESELTGDFEKDRNKIIAALREGRFYLSLDLLANPKGFYAHILDATQNYPMGSHLKFKEKQKIQIGLPAQPMVPYEVLIYRDGVVWKRESSIIVEHEIPGPGVYRAVVRVRAQMPFPDGLKWIHWIYSNPFLVH